MTLRRPELLLSSLLAPLLAASLAAPVFAEDPPDPSATGPYAVGHSAFDVVDANRGDRELRLDVWYPADAEDAIGDPTFYVLLFTLGITSEVAIDDIPISEAGPYPLILFSHGSGGINIQSIVLMETLASHGFFVASPNHTGNSTFDEETDLPYEDAATDRPKDISFLIDYLLGRSDDAQDPWYQAINPYGIGVTGHSFGGSTALAMAAGYAGSAFGPVPPDPRVRAIAPASGVTSLFSDAELQSIEIPTLFLGGTLDTAVPIDPQTTRAFGLMQGQPIYRADVLGATHTHFANICDIANVLIDAGLFPPSWPAIGAAALVQPYLDTCVSPAFPIDEVVRIQNLYTVAFFKRHLLVTDSRYKQYLTAQYAIDNEPDVNFFFIGNQCGLGAELAVLLPPLMWLRHRRNRALR